MRIDEFDRITNSIITENVFVKETIESFSLYIRENFENFEDKCRSYSFDQIVFSEEALKKKLELAKKGETFSEMLICLVREKNLKAPQVYKAAGIDARHYSKIISNRDYKPTKETVFAFCIALQLSYLESEYLMKKAGYAFNSTSLIDVAVEYFLVKKIYDRNLIDKVMEKYGLPLLPQNF